MFTNGEMISAPLSRTERKTKVWGSRSHRPAHWWNGLTVPLCALLQARCSRGTLLSQDSTGQRGPHAGDSVTRSSEVLAEHDFSPSLGIGSAETSISSPHVLPRRSQRLVASPQKPQWVHLFVPSFTYPSIHLTDICCPRLRTPQ